MLFDFNPREDHDCATKIWCWHTRYELGDKDPEKPSSQQFNSFDQVEKYIRDNYDVLHIYPIRMYDHSGLWFSLPPIHYPYDDRWDSGWIGFIFITKEAVRKNFMRKVIGSAIKRKADELLRAEFVEYFNWVSGIDDREEEDVEVSCQLNQD